MTAQRSTSRSTRPASQAVVVSDPIIVQLVTRDRRQEIPLSELMPGVDPARLSDKDLKARVAEWWEVDPAVLRPLAVTRPTPTSILITETPTFGRKTAS